jgi:hypothetical protein
MSNGTGSDSGSQRIDDSKNRSAALVDLVRAWLAFIIVGSFMGVTVVMLLYALFSKTNVDLAAYATFFSQTSSVYTGIVGVVIGYYFGRSQQRIETDGNTRGEAPKQNAPDKGTSSGQ